MSKEKAARGKRLSEQQKAKLLSFMQEPAMFASGRFDSMNGKQKYLSMWSDLTAELNNLGPEKTAVQYQAYWKQKKYQARQANSKRKTALKFYTGNKELPPEPTESEQTIISIIGTETSEGISGEFEWQNISNNEDENIKELDSVVFEIQDIINNDVNLISTVDNIENIHSKLDEHCLAPKKTKTSTEDLMRENNKYMENISNRLNDIATMQSDGMAKMADAMTKVANALNRIADAITVNSTKV